MNKSEFPNKHQLRVLIDEMKINEDIARSIGLKTPTEEHAFWCGLKLKLNKYGPPKLLSEWVKVWADYKSNIRKKVGRNLVSLSKKDPRMFVALNPLEEEVNQLLGIENSILVGLKYSDMRLPNYDSEDDEIVVEDSSSQDIYSLDNFQKRKENSAEIAAKAVKLYDLQIEMLKKELNSLRNIHKKKSEVVPNSLSSTISLPQSPILDDAIQMKVEFEDVEVPCFSANISNDRKHHLDNKEQERLQLKKRKLNTNDSTEKKKVDIDLVTNYGGRIKTEITENEKDGKTKCSTKKGIFIIDTAIPPTSPAPTPAIHVIDLGASSLPPLAPAPPTLAKNLQYTPVVALPTLQPSQNVIKRKFDSSKNTDVPRENNSCPHESILINISNALQEIQQTNNNITYYLERLCVVEEKKTSLMEDANKEQKRHHQQIEKMAKVSLK